MAKRIVAKTGSYQKDGQDKGEYTKIGVILSNDNGEYILMDPCVSLAGLLIKQNALAAKTGGQQRDMVMVSIFDDDNNQQQNNNQGQQAPAQQGGFSQQQAPAKQGGFSNQGQQQQGNYQQR